MAWAIISFPVPVSPTINTAAGCCATCSASRITRLRASLRTMGPPSTHELWTAVDTNLYLFTWRRWGGLVFPGLVIHHHPATHLPKQPVNALGWGYQSLRRAHCNRGSALIWRFLRRRRL